MHTFAAEYPPNFSRSEMLVSATAARHGISNEPTSDEIEANILKCAKFMQLLRNKLDRPIRILSCYRSPEVNRLVGGSKTSAHMRGLAIDFVVPGMDTKKVAEFVVNNFKFDQCIYEFGSWVHVGIATDKSQRQQVLTARKSGGKTVYLTGIA